MAAVMSEMPPTAPLESPALGILLRCHREEVLARWMTRVRADATVPAARRMSEPALRDHIPGLLDRLITSLEGEQGIGSQCELHGRWVGLAEESAAHAHERYAAGYDLPAAVHELAHLRSTILALVATEARMLTPEAELLVHAALDEAITMVAVEISGRHNAERDGLLARLNAKRARLEAEARARDLAHRRLRAVLELLPVGVLIADARGIIQTANAAAAAIWGRPSGSSVLAEPGDRGGVHAWWVSTGAPVESGEWALARALARATAQGGDEVEIEALDGVRRTILDSAVPIRDEKGAVVGAVGVHVDVTARRQAEARARQEAAFGERFLAIVGHDLRSPLTAVLLAAEGLLARERLAEGATRSVRRIARAAHRMQRMLADLLDLVRSRHADGIPVTPQPTDLCAICRAVLDEVGVTCPQRVVRLETSGDGSGTWDPDRLTQVVTNLVNNALDHGPADATVTVTVRGEGDHVVVSVHNDGPPIDPELVPVLFDPFRRGRPGAAQPSRGLGLGLFIVAQIVQAHGGTVTVESAAETGTRFTVSLPRSSSRAAG